MSNLEFVLRELNGRCDFLLLIEAGKEAGRMLGGRGDAGREGGCWERGQAFSNQDMLNSLGEELNTRS